MKKYLPIILSLFLFAPLLPSAYAQAYKEIYWDELVPSEWARQMAKDFGKIYKRADSMEDDDPRIEALYAKLRKRWDEAPISKKYIGKPIRISGYVVPLDAERSLNREFLLVPYFGACIHTPPPPANQIILVVPPVSGGLKIRSMDAIWVDGILSESRVDTDMGRSAYKLEAAKLAPFK
jgi:hypothetical protein